MSSHDATPLDRPEILRCVFHPRREGAAGAVSTAGADVLIPVGDGVVLGGRFHLAHPKGASLLFFHGNGEIVADYDDLAVLYGQLQLNFLPVDYRGYGRSTGTPTVSAMLSDAHQVLAFTRSWLTARGFKGPLLVMGRSLGSAPALELAARHGEVVDGLIIESGFAYPLPLLERLGVAPSALDDAAAVALGNLEKIRRYAGPTLVIHAENDDVIPFSDGAALCEASKAADKRLLEIPQAGHNDILVRGAGEYFDAISRMAERLVQAGKAPAPEG